jgi:hypothetical protein
MRPHVENGPKGFDFGDAASIDRLLNARQKWTKIHHEVVHIAPAPGLACLKGAHLKRASLIDLLGISLIAIPIYI